jgi:hypothetical protein
MCILVAQFYVLWLLFMFQPALGDWSTGDWIIIVNHGLADPDKVLEFNAGNPNQPTNPHPVFMANDPGNTVLGTWDYWYVSVNTDNSYKIYNAYNQYVLDTASDDTTPVILPADNSVVQGWLISLNTDGTFSIYNHYFDKYLGLANGGWPAYMAAATASYTDWSFLPAITTSTVTATSTQTITSTVGSSTSTVTGPSVTYTSTVFATTTRVRAHLTLHITLQSLKKTPDHHNGCTYTTSSKTRQALGGQYIHQHNHRNDDEPSLRQWSLGVYHNPRWHNRDDRDLGVDHNIYFYFHAPVWFRYKLFQLIEFDWQSGPVRHQYAKSRD